MSKDKPLQPLNEQLSTKGHLSSINQGPVKIDKSLSTTGHLSTLAPAQQSTPANSGSSGGSSGSSKGGK